MLTLLKNSLNLDTIPGYYQVMHFDKGPLLDKSAQSMTFIWGKPLKF